MQWICSYVMWPIAFIIGVDANECREAAKLIGGRSIKKYIIFNLIKFIIDTRGIYKQKIAIHHIFCYLTKK